MPDDSKIKIGDRARLQAMARELANQFQKEAAWVTQDIAEFLNETIASAPARDELRGPGDVLRQVADYYARVVDEKVRTFAEGLAQQLDESLQ